GQLIREGMDREYVLRPVQFALVVLELERADHRVPELERDHHEALHVERRVRHPLVARHVVDYDGLASLRYLLPQLRGIRCWLTALRPPDRAPVGQPQRPLL